MTQTTAYEHIVLNEAGVPIIDGTTTKVIEIVLETTAHGWNPEEIQFQHPYLTLGQIQSALAYYREYKEALDRDIERRLERVEQIRRDSDIINRRHARLNKEAKDTIAFQAVTNRAEEKLLHPPPGGRIEAARAHGIDLTLLVERLRLTPEERVRDLQQALRGLEAIRDDAED